MSGIHICPSCAKSGRCELPPMDCVTGCVDFVPTDERRALQLLHPCPCQRNCPCDKLAAWVLLDSLIAQREGQPNE